MYKDKMRKRNSLLMSLCLRMDLPFFLKLKMPNMLRSIMHFGANEYIIDSMPTTHTSCICIHYVYIYSVPTIIKDEEKIFFYSYFKMEL